MTPFTVSAIPALAFLSVSAFDAANAASAFDSRASVARAAAAARAADDAIGAAADIFAVTDVFATADVFAADAAATRSAFWSAISIDATRVEGGAKASIIAGSPLWPNGPPPWPHGQPDRLQSSWLEMKTALDAAAQYWQVWTIWYEDRLFGQIRDENRELAYVRIDDELWEQGLAVVNAEIIKRIEEHTPPAEVHEPPARSVRAGPSAVDAEIESLLEEPQHLGGWPPFLEDLPTVEAIPEQASAATNFGLNSQGLIDVVPDPPALEPRSDSLQRELYKEARDKVQVLVELSPNLLGELIGPAVRFRESLPERIEEVSISRSWSRGNTLRSRLKAHDLSMSNAEPDPARLPPLVAETLRDLVGTWNVFIIGDPKGRALDEVCLGPQEVEAAKQVIATAAPIVEAIERSKNVATPTAIEAVAEQAETAKTAPAGVDGDQAIDLSRKTTGNFVSELLRRAYAPLRNESGFAWKEIRAGAYRAAGTAAFTGLVAGTGAVAYHWPEILSFVARHADTLKAYVEAAWHNPKLVEIIDLIARGWP